MPKKAYLAQHFSSKELKEKYLKSRDPVETRRWHLLWKISLGWTIQNSALAVGYSYPYAQKILNRYNRDGAAGIINRKNQTSHHLRGKKRLLNSQQLEKLKEQMEQTPPDGGNLDWDKSGALDRKRNREKKSLESTNELENTHTLALQLVSLRRSVPHIFLASLPSSFGKTAFFRML